MGKIKMRRSKMSRYNPLSMGINNEINSHADVEFECNSSKKTLKQTGPGLKTHLEKISRGTIEEKFSALNTMAALALEKEDRESIVGEKAVSLIAPLLSNKSPHVQLAAAGTLRNLCIDASDEVLDEMISQYIMKHLVQLLKDYSEQVSADDKCDSLQQLEKKFSNTTDHSVSKYRIFIEAVHILWNLCEGNEYALQAFNEGELIRILVKHINPKIWGFSLSLPIIECLLCVTENNENATTALQSCEINSLLRLCLANKENAKWLHYGVILSGILFNINCYEVENLQAVFEILSSSLELDTLYFINYLCVNKKIAKSQTNGHFPSNEELEFILSSQQLSLEILSNLCCNGEDDDESVEFEDSSDFEECEDHGMMEFCSDLSQNSSLPSEVIEALQYFHFVDKVKKKIEMPMDSLPPSNLEEQRSLYQKCCQIRIRALQCFQNLLNILDLEEIGGTNLLYDLWIQLGKWLCSDSNKDLSLQEAISGAMRVVMDRLRSKECPQLSNISAQDIKQIFEASSMCSLGSARANLARMLGNLGCSIIEKTDVSEISQGNIAAVLTSSTEYLLQVANSDEELFVRAEALDVIIDLFSDDKTDTLALQIHLVERLRGVQPHFKAKLQNMKKKLGDHKPLVLTVRDNLSSFIKYKSERA